MRFRRWERIRRRADYQHVYDHGIRVRGRYSTVFLLANSREGGRLGIAATRKLGGAVARNRAKRLIREVFRPAPTTPPRPWNATAWSSGPGSAPDAWHGATPFVPGDTTRFQPPVPRTFNGKTRPARHRPLVRRAVRVSVAPEQVRAEDVGS